jgi:dihydrofolate reductase
MPMADLIYFINTSLDGYIADEDGDFAWTDPSEDAYVFFRDFQRSIGTVLNGRRMYEMMRVWDEFDLDEMPAVQREFGEAWRASNKVVYSSTLEAVSGPRATLHRAFNPGTVQAMKDEADRDLSIAGPNLAAEAMRAGLVDRYLLRVIPTIVGGGTAALPDGVRVDLEFEKTQEFDDGSVLLEYRVR